MRKPLAIAALLAAAVFGTGYVIGQLTGVLPGYAAGTALTPSVPQNATFQPSDTPVDRLGPHADGQVSAINGDTLTLAPDGNWSRAQEYDAVTTIQLTSGTQYQSGPMSEGATGRSSIKVGSFVIAEGTLSTDGKTLTATRLSLRSHYRAGADMPRSGPHADGQVTAITGNTITVRPDADRAGSSEDASVTTIQLTSATQYGGHEEQPATVTKESIKVGTYVRAEGALSSDGKTLTATRIMLHGTGGTSPHAGFAPENAPAPEQPGSNA